MKQPQNENELVRRIERRFRSGHSNALVLSIGDDAALWEPRSGYETVLTCDWFLEDSHYIRTKHPAEAVGWKCLARAVSDIAAMGGVPRCFLLSVALPAELTGKWFDGFLRGLRRASKALQCTLAGGDTTRQKRVLVNITVIGEVKAGRAVLRSGARPDDLIFVSGTLGEAELGLRLLREGMPGTPGYTRALRKHLYPKPPLALGLMLAERGLASAMMDISDGLSTDLARLCEASGVGAAISEGAVPRPSGLRESEALRLALHGGDDYELLFTVHPSQIRRLKKECRGIPISRIGQITKKRRVLLVGDGTATEELSPRGWDPFRK